MNSITDMLQPRSQAHSLLPPFLDKAEEIKSLETKLDISDNEGTTSLVSDHCEGLHRLDI